MQIGSEDRMVAQRGRVVAQVQEYAKKHRNDRPLADPAFAGWIAWAGFHLDPPAATLAVVGHSDTYASMQYLLMRFAVQALVSRPNVSYDRFIYLTSFVVTVSGDRKSQRCVFDKKLLHNNPYSLYKAFVMQVVVVTPEGLSQTATVWIENGTVEIFNPWEHRSPLMHNIVTTYVIPFLKGKWMTADPVGFEYSVPNNIGYSNYWNTYFVFLRSVHTMEETIRAFSQAHTNLSSLIARRDLVIQTCGRLIARCAEMRDNSANRQNYHALFGPEGHPFELSRDNIETQVPNIFMRCSIPEDKLWNQFEDIFPDAVDGGKNTASVWPTDTDPKWNMFRCVTGKKMRFVGPQ